MNNQPDPSTTALSPQETADILRRILDAVEQEKRKRWVEITCAVVLSLATVGSAWCAYQSTLWGGVQTFRLADANRAGRESAEQSIAAFQGRAFDASMFITYLEVRGRGDQKMAAFLRERFRPEMHRAVEAWLQTDPFNNPKAPKSPFKMAEYVQKEEEEARHQAEEATGFLASAQKANHYSDRYVLFTVLFASVLFFGGIGGTMQSRRLRLSVLAIALGLFVVTVVFLATLPICTE